MPQKLESNKKHKTNASETIDAKFDVNTKGSKKKYSDLVKTSLITLVIGGVFGEFVIKRNVVQFSEQRANYLNSASSAQTKFEDIKNNYNRLIADRRSQSATIQKYMKDSDIVNLDRRFALYRATVDNWNKQYLNMINSIEKATGCMSINEERREQIKQNMLVHVKNAPALHGDLFRKVPELKSSLIADFEIADNVCPTYFLTLHEPDDSQTSVHDSFRKMNKAIFGFRNHDFNDCQLRHINNLDHYYRACSSRVEKTQDFSTCTNYFDKQTKNGDFCSRETYNLSNYKISELDFQKLDFYWNMGNLLMDEYRLSIALKECQSTIGFWGRSLQWDCDKYIEEKLKLW